MSVELAEHVAVISDIIVGLAAFMTAVAALCGLSTWRTEIAGQAHFEAARKLNLATFRLKGAIETCRHPVFAVSEFPPGDYPTAGAEERRRNFERYTHAYRNRWEPVQEAFAEFNSIAVECEALWGHECVRAAAAMRRRVFQLRDAISQYLSSLAPENAVALRTREQQDANRRIRLWGVTVPETETEAVDDQFARDVEAAIAEIGTLTKRHLRH
ncbi:hypothetical protein [Abyssibacter profundi]|uniref:Uncharacterized protein n=1 Tax=Abyssibacter profundi TaxID=2182787 RepID=A0A363UL79_9GAMM|nr:hypothetical protein [Abyssibacter profundi]PWN56175.1 hypothetical protein DEH80_07835 [Abyssibacter profundi]